MTAQAKPRFLWKGWAPGVAVLAITVISALGFVFADMRADEAVRQGREAAVAEATRESARADAAICRIAGTNRAQSILLLETLRERIAQAPLDPGETQAEKDETLALADRLIATARTPFPEPCTEFTPDIPN